MDSRRIAQLHLGEAREGWIGKGAVPKLFPFQASMPGRMAQHIFQTITFSENLIEKPEIYHSCYSVKQILYIPIVVNV